LFNRGRLPAHAELGIGDSVISSLTGGMPVRASGPGTADEFTDADFIAIE
jgi:hypothetical protein